MEDAETFRKTEPGTKVRLLKGWPGEFIDAEELYDLYGLWSELWDTAPYISHIDMNFQHDLNDPNTYLKRRSDRRLLVHKGATGGVRKADRTRRMAASIRYTKAQVGPRERSGVLRVPHSQLLEQICLCIYYTCQMGGGS